MTASVTEKTSPATVLIQAMLCHGGSLQQSAASDGQLGLSLTLDLTDKIKGGSHCKV